MEDIYGTGTFFGQVEDQMYTLPDPTAPMDTFEFFDAAKAHPQMLFEPAGAPALYNSDSAATFTYTPHSPPHSDESLSFAGVPSFSLSPPQSSSSGSTSDDELPQTSSVSSPHSASIDEPQPQPQTPLPQRKRKRKKSPARRKTKNGPAQPLEYEELLAVLSKAKVAYQKGQPVPWLDEDQMQLITSVELDRYGETVGKERTLDEAELEQIRKIRRLLKNRESAHKSRQRKKEKMLDVETSLLKFETENTKLKEKTASMAREILVLRELCSQHPELWAEAQARIPDMATNGNTDPTVEIDEKAVERRRKPPPKKRGRYAKARSTQKSGALLLMLAVSFGMWNAPGTLSTLPGGELAVDGGATDLVAPAGAVPPQQLMFRSSPSVMAPTIDVRSGATFGQRILNGMDGAESDSAAGIAAAADESYSLVAGASASSSHTHSIAGIHMASEAGGWQQQQDISTLLPALRSDVPYFMCPVVEVLPAKATDPEGTLKMNFILPTSALGDSFPLKDLMADADLCPEEDDPNNQMQCRSVIELSAEIVDFQFHKQCVAPAAAASATATSE